MEIQIDGDEGRRICCLVVGLMCVSKCQKRQNVRTDTIGLTTIRLLGVSNETVYTVF